MKVWQKNFLFTLALFTVLLFICIYIVDTLSFSSALQTEREAAIREEGLLSSTLQRDIQSIETRNNYIEGVASRVASFAAAYQKKGIYLILGNGDNILYNNSSFIIGTAHVSAEDRICKTIKQGGSNLVYVYDTLYSSETQGYAFVYIKDITSTYNALYKQSLILNLLGVAVSVIFAFLLYFELKRIYKPVDNLAHELRTPLTAIRGYAEYLQNAAVTEDDRYSATKFIVDESKRLSDICDRLLIIANLREGDIAFEDLDVESLFQNTKMIFKNVDYDIKKYYIMGDNTLIQSMINNFVSNAVKASPKDEPVSLLCYDNIIEVKDRGKGIDPATLSRISRPGYKPDIIGRQSNGNGLGIPLCHRIARIHNAHLEFISKEGEGTTVRVIFTAL